MKEKEKTETLAFCTVCGKNFVYVPKTSKAPKYCGAACKQQAYRIKHNKTKKVQTAATITSLKLELKQAQEQIKQLKEKIKNSSLIINELKKELQKYKPVGLFDEKQ